ncbi:unnamed protein product, partial [Cyprideis torosa]
PTHFSAFVVVQSHRLTNLVPGPSLIDPALEVSSFVRQAPTHLSAFVQSHRLTNLVPGPSLIDPALEVSSFVRQEIKLMIKCLSFVLSTQRSTATIVPFLDNSAMTPKVYLRGTKGKGKITPATTTELNRHLAAVIQMTNEDEKT